MKKFKRLQTFLCPELSAFSLFMSSTSLSFKCKKLQVISRCCTNTFSKYLDPEATEEGGVEVIGKSFNSLNKFSFHCFFNWYFRHKVESNLSNDLNVVSLVQTKCWANYRKGHLDMQKVNRYIFINIVNQNGNLKKSQIVRTFSMKKCQLNVPRL